LHHHWGENLDEKTNRMRRHVHHKRIPRWRLGAGKFAEAVVFDLPLCTHVEPGSFCTPPREPAEKWSGHCGGGGERFAKTYFRSPRAGLFHTFHKNTLARGSFFAHFTKIHSRAGRFSTSVHFSTCARALRVLPRILPA
jgi:hypothetical protein